MKILNNSKGGENINENLQCSIKSEEGKTYYNNNFKKRTNK